jgi:hypothetical protein
MVGDTTDGILYIAYGEQCGIMSYSLAKESKIGYATSIDLPIAANITLTVPACGYADESGYFVIFSLTESHVSSSIPILVSHTGDLQPAVGGLAALSSDIRQITLDQGN